MTHPIVTPEWEEEGMPVKVFGSVLKQMVTFNRPEYEARVHWGEPDEEGFYSPSVEVLSPLPFSEVMEVLTTIKNLMRRLSLDFPEGPVSPEYRAVQMMIHDFEKRGWKMPEDGGTIESTQ